MATPAEKFWTWHAEITAELGEIDEQLPTARAALEMAETAHRTAKASWIALEGFTAAVHGYNITEGIARAESLASPLYSRLMRERDALKSSESVQATTRGLVASLEQRANTLRDALRQIDMALDASKVTALRSAEAVARRKPAPVDFDTIAMPLEAAK